MGRWRKGRVHGAATAGAAIVLVGVTLWGLSVIAHRVAERELSALLGMPVRLGTVRPSGLPPRLLLSGVRVGDGRDAAASAARVYVQAELWAWLRGDLRGAAIEVSGLQVSAEALPEVIVHLAEGASEEGSGVARVRLDDLRVKVPGATTPITLAGFELRDLEAARTAGEAAAFSANLFLVSGSGRIAGDVRREGGAPSLLVDVTVDDAALGSLVRSEGSGLAGVASADLWYEYGYEKGSPSHMAGGDLQLRDLSFERVGTGVLRLQGLRIRDATVDLGRSVVAIGRALARDGKVDGAWLAGVLLGEPTSAVRPGWAWAIEAGRVERLRVTDGARSPLVVQRLDVSETTSGGGAGWLALDASYAGGTVHVEADRPEAGTPGEAIVSIDRLPLSPLFAGAPGAVDVETGTLSGDLRIQGPPGLSAEASLLVRDLGVVVPSGGAGQPLLRVAEIRAEVDRVSFAPPRARLLRGVLVDPHLWIRHDDRGFELERVLRSGQARHTSPWMAFLAGLVQRAGPPPGPTGPPRPLGVRVIGGAVDVRDVAVSPPVATRLREVQALVEGAAGSDGPMRLQAEGRGPGRSSMRVRGETSASEATFELGAQGVRVRDFDAYVRRWTGYEARGGRLGLAAEVHVGRDPRAELRLDFDDVELAPAGDDEEGARWLGMALPEIVARLEHARVPLELSLRGDSDAPAYGFAAGLPEALREGIDRALRSAPVAASAHEERVDANRSGPR